MTWHHVYHFYGGWCIGPPRQGGQNVALKTVCHQRQYFGFSTGFVVTTEPTPTTVYFRLYSICLYSICSKQFHQLKGNKSAEFIYFCNNADSALSASLVLLPPSAPRGVSRPTFKFALQIFFLRPATQLAGGHYEADSLAQSVSLSSSSQRSSF